VGLAQRLAEVFRETGRADPSGRLPTEADSFPAQWPFVCEPTGEQIIAMCSRQAGKSTGAVLRAIRIAGSRPGARILYVTLIRENCRLLFFEPLKQKLEELGWVFVTNESRLTVRLGNGAEVHCRSAEDRKSIGKLRGANWDEIIIDEVQELRDEILEYLLQRVLGATRIRRRGGIVLLFTPPPVQVGYLWDEYKSGRWKIFNWSMADNPWLPADYIDKVLKDLGLTMDHPVARREIRGIWDIDTNALVFEFANDNNTFTELPDDLPADQWRYSYGLDLGWTHPSAISVIAWNRRDPQRRLWEVFNWAAVHQHVDHLTPIFKDLLARFRPMSSAIGDDDGAAGQQTLQALSDRLGFKFAPKPKSIEASVGLVNQNLRTRQLFVRDKETIKEFGMAVWVQNPEKPKQDIDKARFDPHRLDALRYAIWGATPYRNKEPEQEELPPGRNDPPDYRGRLERQRKEVSRRRYKAFS